jgi:hypothetical protein
MNLDPLSPEQVEALLRPDPRTRTADLLVLRDALLRMGGALERLHGAVLQLHRAAGELQRETQALERQVERGKVVRGD